MKMVIVGTKDLAADAFGRPFYVPSIGVAIRSFTDEVNRQAEDNQMYHHPEDFQLYHFGEFDDNTGQFILLEIPKMLISAKQAKITSVE